MDPEVENIAMSVSPKFNRKIFISRPCLQPYPELHRSFFLWCLCRGIVLRVIHASSISAVFEHLFQKKSPSEFFLPLTLLELLHANYFSTAFSLEYLNEMSTIISGLKTKRQDLTVLIWYGDNLFLSWYRSSYWTLPFFLAFQTLSFFSS